MEQDRTSRPAMPGSGSNGNGVDGPPDDEVRREVATRLRDLGQRIAPAEISDVWVFPPLSHLEGSTEFLLFTRFLPDEMRHLCGAEFNVGNGNGHAPAGQRHERKWKRKRRARRRSIASGASRSTERCRRTGSRGWWPGSGTRLGDHREPFHFEIGGFGGQLGGIGVPGGTCRRLIDRLPQVSFGPRPKIGARRGTATGALCLQRESLRPNPLTCDENDPE